MADPTAEEVRIEAFAPGLHQGRTYTEADLDAMVRNADLLKEFHRAPITYGHPGPEDSSAPAAGWVHRLAKENGKLVVYASLTDEARKRIQAEEFKHQSIGFYTDWSRTEAEKNLQSGAKGPVLQHLALLGAVQPHVRNLAPIQLGEELLCHVEMPFDNCDDCDLASKEQIVALAGNVEGLAQHIVDKYGTNHPFTECMSASELSSYDDATKKMICGRVKALKGEKAKGMTERELEAVVEYLAQVRLAEGDVTKGGEFVGGFQGCVDHMMSKKGLPEENAKKLCAFIGRQAGKIPMAEATNRNSPPTEKANTSPEGVRMADEKTAEQIRIEELEAKLAEQEKATAKASERATRLSEEATKADQLEAMNKQMEERLVRLEEERAAAIVAANEAAAEQYAYRECNTPEGHCLPIQKPILKALFSMLSDEPVVDAADATDLRLFGEKETPRKASARDLFKKFVATMPSKQSLFVNHARQDKAQTEDVKALAEQVAKDHGWDKNKADDLRLIFAEVARLRPDLRQSA